MLQKDTDKQPKEREDMAEETEKYPISFDWGFGIFLKSGNTSRRASLVLARFNDGNWILDRHPFYVWDYSGHGTRVTALLDDLVPHLVPASGYIWIVRDWIIPLDIGAFTRIFSSFSLFFLNKKRYKGIKKEKQVRAPTNPMMRREEKRKRWRRRQPMGWVVQSPCQFYHDVMPDSPLYVLKRIVAYRFGNKLKQETR